MRLRDACVTVTVALGLWIAPAGAQPRTQLRFAPEAGRMARTLTEIRTATTLVGFPAVPDGATVEEERWVSATQRVTGAEPGGTMVAVTIDSVRGRMRIDTDPWVDLDGTPLVGRMTRAVVSPRFAIVGIRTSAATDNEVLQVLGAWAAGLGFAFPEAPVTAGETFDTGGRLRARVTTDSTTGLAIDEVVFGDLALTVDSIVPLGDEELTYLHFRGGLTPRTAAAGGESGEVVTALGGSFAGRLVWSAHWGAFVSGALRVRVEGTVRAEGPRGAQVATATWDRTVLHRVRP